MLRVCTLVPLPFISSASGYSTRVCMCVDWHNNQETFLLLPIVCAVNLILMYVCLFCCIQVIAEYEVPRHPTPHPSLH